MTDPEHIPHLIKLLDDDSEEVRAAAVRELTAFGPVLKTALQSASVALNTVQKEHLDGIFMGQKRIWLKRVWPGWLKRFMSDRGRRTSYRALEEALELLAAFLGSSEHDRTALAVRLDRLAAEYAKTYHSRDPAVLAKFLFRQKKIRGDEDDYYNPQNCNLAYVIKERSGIPLTLTALYMLVGARLGIRIEGCHFPGHFLARINRGSRKVFVDCFNRGHLIEEKDLLSIKREIFKGMARILHEPTDVTLMIRSYLANLIRACQVTGERANARLLIKLFGDMDAAMHRQKAADLTPEAIINVRRPDFRPGARVKHARYGYRGIIVDDDPECLATDDWYYGNQTQPSRHQPWYHVLVHGSEQVTYVAECNLKKDTSRRKFTHPLLHYFFDKMPDGTYIRNANAWPATDF